MSSNLRVSEDGLGGKLIPVREDARSTRPHSESEDSRGPRRRSRSPLGTKNQPPNKRSKPPIDINLPLDCFLRQMVDYSRPSGFNPVGVEQTHPPIPEPYTFESPIQPTYPSWPVYGPSFLSQASNTASVWPEVNEGCVSFLSASLLFAHGVSAFQFTEVQTGNQALKLEFQHLCQVIDFHLLNWTPHLTQAMDYSRTEDDQGISSVAWPVHGQSANGSGPLNSLLLAFVALDSVKAECGTLKYKTQLGNLSIAFNKMMMTLRRSSAEPSLDLDRSFLYQIVDWIKSHLKWANAQAKFDSAALVFENPSEAAIFWEFVQNVGYVKSVLSTVSHFLILPGGEPPLVIRLRNESAMQLSPIFNPNLVESRCAMMADLSQLSGGHKFKPSLEGATALYPNLTSRAIWTRGLNYSQIMVLDATFLPQSEENLILKSVTLGRLGEAPEAAMTLDNPDNESQQSILESLVATLNKAAENSNRLVLLSFSSHLVVGPIIKSICDGNLYDHLHRDKIGIVDLTPLDANPFAHLNTQLTDLKHVQTNFHKLQALGQRLWNSSSITFWGKTQPLCQSTLVLESRNIKVGGNQIVQRCNSNVLSLKVSLSDGTTDQAFLVKDPKVHTEWRVTKAQRNKMCMSFHLKQKAPTTQIASLGTVLFIPTSVLPISDFAGLAHLLSPRCECSFVSLELWNRVIPIVNPSNKFNTAHRGNTIPRAFVDSKGSLDPLEPRCEIILISLGCSNRKLNEIVAKNLSNKCTDIHMTQGSTTFLQKRLKTYLGSGKLKILIGHNLHESMPELTPYTAVEAIVEIEWLLPTRDRMDFHCQPSWGSILAKVLDEDFPFMPDGADAMSNLTEKFLQALPHLNWADLEKAILPYAMPIVKSFQTRPSNFKVLFNVPCQLPNPIIEETHPKNISVRPMEDLQASARPALEELASPGYITLSSEEEGEVRESSTSEDISSSSPKRPKSNYLNFNLLILNLKTTIMCDKRVSTSLEAFYPSCNHDSNSFHCLLLPEGVPTPVLESHGYTSSSHGWKLALPDITRSVTEEADAMISLNSFIKKNVGPEAQYVLVVSGVETFGLFVKALIRAKLMNEIFDRCRGWIDLRALVTLRNMEPREFFIKCFDVDPNSLANILVSLDPESFERVKRRTAPNLMTRILKTFGTTDFYSKCFPLNLDPKRIYSMIMINVEWVQYSTHDRVPSISVIHAKRSGQAFSVAVEPYGSRNSNLVKVAGFGKKDGKWSLVKDGNSTSCVSLQQAMIQFLRFICNDDENVKSILVCGVFRHTLSLIFQAVEFLDMPNIFFKEIEAIFDISEFLRQDMRKKYPNNLELIEYYKNLKGGEFNIELDRHDARDQMELLQDLLQVLSKKSECTSVGMFVVKHSILWGSPIWDRLLRETNDIMFQDHVYPIHCLDNVKFTNQSTIQFASAKVRQQVVKVLPNEYVAISHPMANNLVLERLHTAPDKEFELKIYSSDGIKIEAGTIVGFLIHAEKLAALEAKFGTHYHPVIKEELLLPNLDACSTADDIASAGAIKVEALESPDVLPMSHSIPIPALASLVSQAESKLLESSLVDSPKPLANPKDQTDVSMCPPTLDSFVKFLPIDDEVQSENALSIDGTDLSDTFITLTDYPCFEPLLQTYVIWCRDHEEEVDEDIGDEFVTCLVGIGCDSMRELQSILQKISGDLTTNSIKRILLQEYSALSVVIGKAELDRLLNILALYFTSPVPTPETVEKPNPSPEDPPQMDPIAVELAIEEPQPEEGKTEQLLARNSNLRDEPMEIDTDETDPKKSTMPIQLEQLMPMTVFGSENATIGGNEETTLEEPTPAEVKATVRVGTHVESESEKVNLEETSEEMEENDFILEEKASPIVPLPDHVPKDSDLEKIESIPEELITSQEKLKEVDTCPETDPPIKPSLEPVGEMTKEPIEARATPMDVNGLEAMGPGETNLEESKENICEATLIKDDKFMVLDAFPVVGTEAHGDSGEKNELSNTLGLNVSTTSPESPRVSDLEVETDNDTNGKADSAQGNQSTKIHQPRAIVDSSYGRITNWLSGEATIAIAGGPNISIISSSLVENNVGQTCLVYKDANDKLQAILTQHLPHEYPDFHWGFVTSSESGVCKVGFFQGDCLNFALAPRDQIRGVVKELEDYQTVIIQVEEDKSIPEVGINYIAQLTLTHPSPMSSYVKTLDSRRPCFADISKFFGESALHRIDDRLMFCRLPEENEVFAEADFEGSITWLRTRPDSSQVRNLVAQVKPNFTIVCFFRGNQFLSIFKDLEDRQMFKMLLENTPSLPELKSFVSIPNLSWIIPSFRPFNSSEGKILPIHSKNHKNTSAESRDSQNQPVSTPSPSKKVGDVIPKKRSPIPALMRCKHVPTKPSICQTFLKMQSCPFKKGCRNQHGMPSNVKLRYCHAFLTRGCFETCCNLPHLSGHEVNMQFRRRVTRLVSLCMKCKGPNPITNVGLKLSPPTPLNLNWAKQTPCRYFRAGNQTSCMRMDACSFLHQNPEPPNRPRHEFIMDGVDIVVDKNITLRPLTLNKAPRIKTCSLVFSRRSNTSCDIIQHPDNAQTPWYVKHQIGIPIRNGRIPVALVNSNEYPCDIQKGTCVAKAVNFNDSY